MAKKKIKISVKEKLHYKKPLKNCAPAVKDISRIRNNEQAKLRYRKKKLDTILFKAVLTPGKGVKGLKKQADALHKEIKTYERGIKGLNKTVTSIRGACTVLDGNRAQIKSLKLKTAAIDRKLNKMYENRDLRPDEIKRLNTEALKNQNLIKDLQRKNNDVLYTVNKDLGFSPVEVAKRLGIRKRDLEKLHKDDFDEEYFEEAELEEIQEGEGAGGGLMPEGLEDLELEEGLEADQSGYIIEMDEPFWTVAQDFSKNEKFKLSGYEFVTISFDGGTYRFAGKNIILIEMKFNEMVRWCNAQSAKSTDDSVARIEKSVTLDGTRLKYYGYIIEGI